MEELLEIESKNKTSHYELVNGYPTEATAKKANDDCDLIRAISAYRFFYPTVSMEATMQGQRDAGTEDNTTALIAAGGPRHMLFTGNSDTPYMGVVANLRETGPLVIELPPGPYLGFVNDHHYRWIHDIGLPGEDAGKGGKHLILPPDYTGDIPNGYYSARAQTFMIMLGVRALPVNGDINAGLEAQRKVNIYPFAKSENPPDLIFLDKTTEKVDITPLQWEDNFKFWIKLYKVIQEEPPLNEFRPMYGALAAIGIEKDKPFAPDERMTAFLEKAARIGRDQMLVSAFASNRSDRFVWPDRKWEWAALRWENGDFELPTGIDLEARERWFAQAIGMSPKMVLRTEGAGSLYWLGLRDASGAYLQGGKSYVLKIPQPVPQKLFWSITVYDAMTRSQIQTDQDNAALRSLIELKGAAQSGSIDLHFGPTAPLGKENAWIKTIPERGWFAYLRLYGPEKPAFDGEWKPGDFEEI